MTVRREVRKLAFHGGEAVHKPHITQVNANAAWLGKISVNIARLNSRETWCGLTNYGTLCGDPMAGVGVANAR